MILEDCYFFMTSTCTKGISCPFRHSMEAKATEDICPEWASSHSCPQNGECGKRHSDFNSASKFSSKESVLCFFEKIKGACNRPNCSFKHLKKTEEPKEVLENAPAVSKKEEVLAELEQVEKEFSISMEKIDKELNELESNEYLFE